MKIQKITIIIILSILQIKSLTSQTHKKPSKAQNPSKYHYSKKKHYNGKTSRITLEKNKIHLTTEIPENFVFPTDEEDPSIFIYKFYKHEDQHFENLTHLEKIVNNLKDILRAKIFGNLQTSLLVNKQQISYSIYKVINDVRNSYFTHKYSARFQIYKIRDMIELIKNYTILQKETAFEKLVDFENLEADQKNLDIFEDLINQLEKEIAILWESIFSGLDLFFEDLLRIHLNTEIDDAERIVQLMKSSINLVSFEGELNKRTKKILDLKDVIIDNPKYDHINHLYNKEFHPELVGKGQKAGVGVLAGFAAFLVFFV